MAIDEQKAKVFDLYGTASDEVCYAHKRLEKLGVKPFRGRYNGKSSDILAAAIAQARKDDEPVSVFLNNFEVQGLFVVFPTQAPAGLTYAEFTRTAAQKRWDKPIDQQKKEEEFDRFKGYEYSNKIYTLYGTISDELCYAHERLEKMGVSQFVKPRGEGRVDRLFAAAMQQAKAENKKVALNLLSGVIRGLFVISPDQSADDPEYCKAKFEEYVRDQEKLRWDKPIDQQKEEEGKTGSQTPFSINKIGVNVKNGNIATEDVDCIVVPEFSDCASRGGVGYAMEAAGMGAGLDAYDKAVQNQPMQNGSSIITESGKAGVKIAHVATANSDKDSQLGAVNTAIFNTLVSADAKGLKSIAIPELGTGIIGSLTQEQSAKAIFNAVYKFSTEYPSSGIENISLVVYRGSTAPAEKVLSEKSYMKLAFDEKGKKEFDAAKFMFEMSKING